MGETRVLCVGPDRSRRESLAKTLRDGPGTQDWTVDCRGDADAAISAIETARVDCLVTEYDLPDGTGLELADRVRSAAPDAGIVLFTDLDPDAIDTGDLGSTVTEYVDRTGPGAETHVATLVEMTVAGRNQVSYPLPADESGRLAALEEYDFSSEALNRSFDRLTELAVQHFGVGSASVNVIEEHEQRLLACRGLDLEDDSTSRDASICTFTILEDGRVMTVDDVREDPRFESRHEDFEAAGIRSYMGAQLVAPEGYALGTLCIYDEQPREFSRAERDFLRTLADLGVDLLTAEAGGGATGPSSAQGEDATSEENGEPTDGETGDDETTALGEAFR